MAARGMFWNALTVVWRFNIVVVVVFGVVKLET
jgi:hypothetical protein